MTVVAPTPRKGLADRLCEEHTALARRTDLLRAVADEIGAMPLGRLRHDIDSAYDLLAAGIIPHAQHERDLRLHLAIRDCRRVGVRADELELESLTRELAAVRSRSPTPAATPPRRSSGRSSTSSTPSRDPLRGRAAEQRRLEHSRRRDAGLTRALPREHGATRGGCRATAAGR